MKIAKYLMPLLVFSLNTFAANINFQIDSIVQNYVAKAKNGITTGHRSGITSLQIKKLKEPETDNCISDSIDKPGLDLTKWKNKEDKEYAIQNEELKTSIINKLKDQLLSYGNFSYSFSPSDGRFEFNRNDLKMKDDGTFEFLGNKLDSLNLLTIADDILINLKIFNGHVEFGNTIKGILNGEIYQLTARYRRIFRGGIVLGDVSYLSVQLSSTGELISISGRWPKFVSNGKDEEAIDIEEGLDLATEFYQTDFNGTKAVVDDEQIEPTGARLVGIALAWQPMRLDTTSSAPPSLLTPCYATRANVTLKNGDVAPHFFSFPRLSKYANAIRNN